MNICPQSLLTLAMPSTVGHRKNYMLQKMSEGIAARGLKFVKTIKNCYIINFKMLLIDIKCKFQLP